MENKNGITYEEWEKIIQDPDFLLKLAYRWKEDRDARTELEAENAALKKENAKVKRISEMIEKIDGDELVSVTEIAREYGRPATWLNGILHIADVRIAAKRFRSIFHCLWQTDRATFSAVPLFATTVKEFRKEDH